MDCEEGYLHNKDNINGKLQWTVVYNEHISHKIGLLQVMNVSHPYEVDEALYTNLILFFC